MKEPTLKDFVLEYAKLHGHDPVDIALLGGAIASTYFEQRPECLEFVNELKTNAPTLFNTIALIRLKGEQNDNG